MIAKHLLQRIFGTMILAASDPARGPGHRRPGRVDARLGRRLLVLLDHAVGAGDDRLRAEPATSRTPAATWRWPSGRPRCGRARRGRRALAEAQASVAAASGEPAAAREVDGGRRRAVPARRPAARRRALPARELAQYAVKRPGSSDRCWLPGTASRPGRGEQLEGDVVGVAERQARAVAGVLDLAVGDAELVEAGGPLDQLAAAGCSRTRCGRGPGRRSSNGSLVTRSGKPWSPSSVPPTAYTMCRNGPVSSSRTGSTPRTLVYQASLASRSDTVTATWVMAGMVVGVVTVVLLLG